MKADLSEIVCVVDRSGSMASIANDAIGGLNTFLAEQKRLPGEARLSLVLFDHEYLLEADGKPINQVETLTSTTYVPRGSTALLDAVGRAITTVGERLAKTPDADRPAQVIVAILTDGQENASKEYTRGRVAEMIKHQQEQYSWQFIFLAANQDAFTEARILNIPISNAANFTADAVGTTRAFNEMSTLTASFRAGNTSSGAAWQGEDSNKTNGKPNTQRTQTTAKTTVRR